MSAVAASDSMIAHKGDIKGPDIQGTYRGHKLRGHKWDIEGAAELLTWMA